MLLVGPLATFFALRGVGVAFAPVLLKRAPIVLALISPLIRHLVLVSPALDVVTFYVVAMCGLFFADPFGYLVGREYGDDAIRWIERQSGSAGRFVRVVERLFARAGVVVLFLAPGPIVCLLAGAARMRVSVWLTVNLLGTFTGVTLIRLFGDRFAATIDRIVRFVEANVLVLTIVSVAFVVVSMAMRRRRARAALATQGEDDVVDGRS